jgi:hypothetical protein
MTETEYTLSLADFKAAQRLRIGANLSTMVRYYLVVWAFPAIVIGIDLGFLWQASQHQPHFRGTDLAIGMMFLCITIFILRFATRFRTMPHKMSKAVAGKTIRFHFDEETFGAGIPGETEVKSHWNVVKGYQEDEKVALLLLGEEKLFTLPRRALNEAQWVQLRAVIAAKLRDRQGEGD